MEHMVLNVDVNRYYKKKVRELERLNVCQEILKI